MGQEKQTLGRDEGRTSLNRRVDREMVQRRVYYREIEMEGVSYVDAPCE